MSNKEKQLKILYLYTAISTLIFGMVILIAPNLYFSLSDMPIQDQAVFGIVGCVWIAFGTCSIFGFREPVKFAPVLLMQFLYKSIWIIGVFLPLLILGKVGIYIILFLITFLTYIVPDILFIPWKELLKKSN